ncbi:hypothetical protein B0T10DRAFT_467023 [Thelonectria olida]|uniref:Uncharacterized protein n=1 Tax=Thelonectria olida TaxID=1576542 RepID=A0A9P8VP79_9HYPO|nr:hypothetical protein B0T10DRAFT_467023 [Thelonectria olida]
MASIRPGHDSAPETPYRCPLALNSSQGQDSGLIVAETAGSGVGNTVHTATPISDSSNSARASRLPIATLEMSAVPKNRVDGNSQGSEDLNHINSPCDEDHCTSVTTPKKRGQESETSDEDGQCRRKRCRVENPPPV